MRRTLAIALAFGALVLGLLAPIQANAASAAVATPYTTKATLTVTPSIVHTSTWTKFTGHVYWYDANTATWKRVVGGTVQIRYRYAGTTTWYTMTTAKTNLDGWFSVSVQWPLTRGAVVLAKLLATAQVKNAWSPTTWVMRVADSVQLDKLAGQFCSPSGASGIQGTSSSNYRWLKCTKTTADPYLRWRYA